ncbi:MAG: nicotinic acid mononucleotide adenylyltransferase [Hyphomicrobium sp.]
MAGSASGLMGGTFNPPHEGHALCAMTALRRLDLDQLWWMVTPGNPLKTGEGLPSLEARMAASRRLVSDPRIKVTGFEAALGSPYTYATVRYLTRRLPAVHFVWVMGGRQPRHVLPLAALARDCRAAADRRRRPSGLAAEGARLAGGGAACWLSHPGREGSASARHVGARLGLPQHAAVGSFVYGFESCFDSQLTHGNKYNF